ncbi:hypothetical protein PIB30_075097 [Stylosanthes scabra]|uniref:Uncharacterized protein n=1 Tax=Stylosanthes scabra TaxID=79078 RepID=A0ABU6SRG6_9FABA|nr:hypothetical protein [Stylosanthes scabra]
MTWGVSRANIPVLGVIYAIYGETPIIYILRKNINVRGNERVVIGEVRTVVIRDIYWIGRVAKITDRFRSLYRTENPVVGILTPYCSTVFQTAGSLSGRKRSNDAFHGFRSSPLRSHKSWLSWRNRRVRQ